MKKHTINISIQRPVYCLISPEHGHLILEGSRSHGVMLALIMDTDLTLFKGNLYIPNQSIHPTLVITIYPDYHSLQVTRINLHIGKSNLVMNTQVHVVGVCVYGGRHT